MQFNSNLMKNQGPFINIIPTDDIDMQKHVT